MIAIEVEGISKKFKDKLAVDGLSMSIKEGELFALLGVNGAGKFTLIKTTHLGVRRYCAP